MKRIVEILLGLAFLLCALPAVAASEDVYGMGTWIGRAEGTTNPGKSERRIYEDRGGGVVFSIREGVDAQGKAFYSAYAAKYDGKDYPRQVKGSGEVTTIALTRVDANSSTFVLKTDGKVTANGRRVIRDGGKTLLVETTNVGGKPNVVMYEKAP